ncbi:MAG TPA: ABC transporter permease, partial [Bryobacteraceae bacterium]|nr:ABC transporter permease [Bryobacteraceae bacterium]
KTPTMTAVVAITLAVGIGANALIFSFVNGFLLKPLPVPHPEQIAVLAAQQKGSSQFLSYFSYPDFIDFRKQADSFADLFGYIAFLPALSADGHADQLLASYVTGNYFSVLGVKPLLGRLVLASEENQPGEQPVLVLGYSYWQKRFGGNPRVIGKQVRVNGKQATIVGVVPKQFQGVLALTEMDIYVPLSNGAFLEQASAANPATDRNARMVSVLARLKPGVSFSQAQASINVIASRLAKQYPSSDANVTVDVYREQLARPRPLGNNIVAAVASFFLILGVLLLLLACMNVVNVLLARATVRQREMGLRAALGAGRGRLIRQMLTETLLLGLLGGLLGVILGEWANPGNVSNIASSSSSVPVRLDFSFDWHVFAYSFVAALFAGAFVGLWPALRASRADLNSILQGGAGETAGKGRHRLRSVLVVAQLAGSLLLLIVAGLFVRSLRHAETMYLGFDPEHVLNVSVNPQGIGYDQTRSNEFYRELEARARALPGVESVSLSYGVPMGNTNIVNAGAVTFEGQQLPAGQQPPSLFFNSIDPGYFATMRIPLVRGREFSDFDNENAPQVAIVNQTMADRFYPHQDPIGKRFSVKAPASPAKTLQIVGIAGNGKYVFIAEEPTPFFYVPLAQNYVSTRALQVRSSGRPETLLAPVQNVIHKLAPDLPIMDARTMKQTLEGQNGLSVFRAGATVAAEIGAIALILAVVGIYGIVSFSAAQRTREIGIRMALGGSARDVISLILQQGVRLVAVGLGIGLLAALGITRVMTRLLVGVSPSDPLTYASVALLLAAIALAACWIPARRATHVDPNIALRYE